MIVDDVEGGQPEFGGNVRASFVWFPRHPHREEPELQTIVRAVPDERGAYRESADNLVVELEKGLGQPGSCRECYSVQSLLQISAQLEEKIMLQAHSRL